MHWGYQTDTCEKVISPSPKSSPTDGRGFFQVLLANTNRGHEVQRESPVDGSSRQRFSTTVSARCRLRRHHEEGLEGLNNWNTLAGYLNNRIIKIVKEATYSIGTKEAEHVSSTLAKLQHL